MDFGGLRVYSFCLGVFFVKELGIESICWGFLF